jgi:hypothetical protein
VASDLRAYPFGPFPFGVNRDCDTVYGQRPGQMKAGQVYDAHNVTMPRGPVQKRMGFAPMGAALSGIIQVLYDYYDLTGTQHTLAIGTAGAWSWSDSTRTWTSLGTLHGNTLAIPWVTVFNGTLVLCNQTTTDGLQSITGSGPLTAITGSGAPASARALQGYENHLLAIDPTLGGVEYPYRVMWSDFNSITNWASGDAAIVDLLDVSDPLMALGTLGVYGTLFPQHSVYNILPAAAPAFYQFQQQVTRGGIAAPSSLRQISLGAPYLSFDDLYIYNGSSDTPFGGGYLRPVLSQGGPKFMLLSAVVSTVNESGAEYWISFPSSHSSTQNDLVAVIGYQGVEPGSPGYVTFYDLTASALGARTLTSALTWDVMTTWPSYAGVAWNSPGTSARFPVMLYANGPQVYQQGPGFDDNGVAITSTVTTGLADFGVEGEKELQRVLVVMDGEPSVPTATVSVSVLTSDTGNLKGAVSHGPYTGAVGSARECWIDCDDVPAARYFGVAFTHAVLDQDIGLRDLVGLWRVRSAQ